MAKKITFIIIFTFLLLFFFLNLSENKFTSPGTDINDASKTKISVGNKYLLVDIVDEDQERWRGLSGREKLGENEGMLFIFPNSENLSFWMKNMNFSLDIIWIDENLKIIGITENVSPDTFPATFSPPSPSKYVLEVNAGWSYENKIRTGDFLILP